MAPQAAMPNPNPTPDDDAALMLAYAAGNAQAFGQLYQRHHQALYRFVRRLLGPALAAQADEVYQDVWLRVVQQRSRYQPGAARFRTWLFTLAHHRAVDALRLSGREVSATGADDSDSAAAPEPAAQAWAAWPQPGAGPADTAFWRRAGQQLLHCLEQLPVAQKTAFLLHHEDGVPVDELARALGLGFETAKSRLRYAMAKLRLCMGAHLQALEPGR